MSDSEKRKSVGDRYLHGFGIEIGAGLARIDYTGIDGMVVVDKRTPAQFESLFGSPPPEKLMTLDEARRDFPAGVDFVIAHHVIEHCDNPIHVLTTEWLPLLAPGGTFYISLPSENHECERNRVPTPIEHILDDFYFRRSSTSYDSKDHIYSFILQWTTLSTDNFWFAKDDVRSFANEALRQVLVNEQDLHWHTYTLTVAAQMIEVAFYAAGLGVEWLLREETQDNNLYLVCKEVPLSGVLPACLNRYKQRLLAAAAAIVSPM